MENWNIDLVALDGKISASLSEDHHFRSSRDDQKEWSETWTQTYGFSSENFWDFFFLESRKKKNHFLNFDFWIFERASPIFSGFGKQCGLFLRLNLQSPRNYNLIRRDFLPLSGSRVLKKKVQKRNSKLWIFGFRDYFFHLLIPQLS